MSKQTKIRKGVWIVIGVVTIAVVAVFAIVKNYPTKPEYSPGMSLEDIIRWRKTWNVAFASWFGMGALDFTVTDIEGIEHRLSDYHGRDVLVVFWATWCQACNMEIPHLIKLRKMFGEDKLVILAISDEPPGLLKQFAAARQINYAVVSLVSSALPAPFANVTSTPTAFFIDRKGTIKFATEGLVSLEETKAIIQAE
jgi:peroxiredoxin